MHPGGFYLRRSGIREESKHLRKTRACANKARSGRKAEVILMKPYAGSAVISVLVANMLNEKRAPASAEARFFCAWY